MNDNAYLSKKRDEADHMNVLFKERPSASTTSPCVEVVKSAVQMVRWRHVLARLNRDLRAFYPLSQRKDSHILAV